MRNFEYYTPTQVLFGKDTHLQAGSLLKKYGAKKFLSIMEVRVLSVPD